MFIRIPKRFVPTRKPGPFARYRVCKVPDCGTRLNLNNPGPLCMRHWIEQIPPEERIEQDR